MRRAGALLALMVTASPALADEGATLAVHAWKRACLDHAGRMEALAARLGKGGDWEVPVLPAEAAEPLLAGRRGTAHAYPNRVTGAAILLLDGGGCSVAIQKADGAALRDAAEKALAASLGKLSKPKDSNRDGVAERRWTVGSYQAAVTSAPDAPIQGALTLLPQR